MHMCPDKLVSSQFDACLFSQLPNMATVGRSGSGFMNFSLIFGVVQSLSESCVSLLVCDSVYNHNVEDE
jgi:hypothetical protein